MHQRLVVGLMLLLAFSMAAAVSIRQDAEAPSRTETQKERAVEYVLMKTSLGEIVLELNREKAPISVENFLKYVDDEFYDGTIYHRVISSFMIQGGGFTKDMQQKKTRDPIKNEWKNGLSNKRGTIAMARTSAADSATSQFFINVVDNFGLDQPRDGAAYAVFGKVAAGMGVVDKIRDVETTVVTTSMGPMRDVPVEIVEIEKVTRLTPEDAKKKIKAIDGDESGDE